MEKVQRPSRKPAGSRHGLPLEAPNQKPDLPAVINLMDFERVAEQCLIPKTLAYWSGAANDCITQQQNRSAWEKVMLRPQHLHDVSSVDMKTTILGHEFELPIFTSPFGMARLAHEDGERNIARAAVAAGVTMVVSTYASFTFADIMSVVPKNYPMFFQLYVNKDRKKTERMIKHVVRAGAKALFITIDLPVVGKRETDERIATVLNARSGNAEASSTGSDEKGHGLARTTATDIDPSFSWKDLEWIRGLTDLPIVLKGVQTAADAKKAMDAGCQGILISNHGGRAVDTAPASLLILLELHLICPEIFQKIEVLIDGGVRRGTDVLKAICLGARGVGIGRPVLYSNVYGEDGVRHLFNILRDELQTAMQLCGIRQLSDASPDYVNTAQLDFLVSRGYHHPYATKAKRSRL